MWQPRSLQMRFATVVAAAVLLLCVIAGGVAHHVTQVQESRHSRDSLTGLSRAVENTVAIGAFARDDVLLAEVADGLVGNELVAAIEIRGPAGELLIGRTASGSPRRHPDLMVESQLKSPFQAGDSVGRLIVWGDANHMSELASREAMAIGSLMVGQGLVIALLLYAVGARLVSRPVVELARQLEITHPGSGQRLSLPGRERDDEIGILVRGTNKLLDATTRALEAERMLRTQIEQVVEHRTSELRVAKDQAVAASRAKSLFLATMSHEIRTPLNGVLGMNELLLHSPLESRQKEWAQAVQSSGQHLLSVINDILDYSKIESGQMDLEALDIDLPALIHEVLSMFAHTAESKGVELVAHYAQHDPALTRVQGDPLRLRQVLANLVGNAVKFTERGEVVVHVSRQLVADGTMAIEIAVKDTGVGIPVSAHAGIFESFSQADGSTTRRYGGTGLGLAICKRLLTLMGGHITLQSTPGKGSCFTVSLRLPLARVAHSRLVDASPLVGSEVLIVDDNRASRTMLRELLEGYGMVVDEAASGRQALDLLQSGRPVRMAIVDLHMPEMSGLQFTQAVRAMPWAAGMPVMLLTSAISTVDGPLLAKLGVRHHMNKPVRREELLAALCSMLGVEGWLPRACPAAPRANAADCRLQGSVLVVEDNPTNQKVATAMLAALGLHTTVAENGEVALNRIQAQRFDLVLMDCQMPVMDGYAATAAIRALAGDVARTPVLALTANALQGDEARCLAAGMDGFLPKPLSLERLATTLAHWLPAATATPPSSPSPASDVPAAAPVAGAINMRQIATLRDIGSRAGSDLVGEVLRSFVAASAEPLARIAEAIETRDATRLARCAHAQKSSAANLGAEELSALYRRLEALARANQIDEAEVLLHDLRRVHLRVVQRAHEILEEAA